MAGYVVAHIERVTDQTEFEDYRSKVEATITQYGGRFIVRGTPTAKEGEWPGRLVVLEFPSKARAEEWYHSAEYKPLLEQRLRCAVTRVAISEGV